MDYIQAFCGVLAAAYFIWVAKSWWNTDVDVLLFQRKVWLVICAALILLLTYGYGVLAGSGAVIQTVVEAAHIDLSKADQAKTVGLPKSNYLEKVLIPNWVPFYLAVLWAEISLAISMPQRKRTHSQAGVEQQGAKQEGSSTEPDRTG